MLEPHTQMEFGAHIVDCIIIRLEKMTTQILNTYKRRINSLKIITNEALVENIPASGLSWDNGTPEQISFMRQVYDACVSYSSSRGTFVADIPDSQLTTIEGKPLKSNAAEALSNLLREARSTASSNGIDITLGLTSGYRTASHQFRLWNRYFIQKYYPRTAPERANLDGGEHGSSAVIFMARHVRRYIASPGYSKHNSGVAVDFRNIENGRTFRNNSDSQHTSAWRTSWFYNWLLSNGSRFNYQPYAREPWHWSYTGANNAEEDIDESYNLNSREILFITTHPIA